MSLAELEALLLVQERDTATDRLRHRRATLAERQLLQTRRAEAEALRRALAETGRQRDEVLGEERRLDDEAQSLAAKAKDMEARLYSGSVTSPRELQAMQADVESLERHRSGVEDRELEVMERREDLDRRVGDLEARLAAAEAEIFRLEAALAAAETEIDAELAVEEKARAGHAAGVPEALLADYEKQRAANKGAGAARLVGVTCQGCHLSIPHTEAERIHRAAGESVAHCDNCGCILVPA